MFLRRTLVDCGATMGVDGIGGGGGPPKTGGPVGAEGASRAPGAGGASEPDRVFEVDRSPGVAPQDALANDDLKRLELGELTREQYLDARVAQAISHLDGALGPEQLEALREQLRDQLTSDPTMQRLLQRATGVAQADNEG